MQQPPVAQKSQLCLYDVRQRCDHGRNANARVHARDINLRDRVYSRDKGRL